MRSSLSYYLSQNKNRVNEFVQTPFNWTKYQCQPLTDLSEFRDCIKTFKTNYLSRKDVLELYKDTSNWYCAFIATMMWGQINHQRPSLKGNKKTTNFFRALNMGQDAIEEKLMSVYNLIKNDETEKAYNSMLPFGKNYIEGVGESYFTKIFYFLGALNEKSQRTHLIYDKWTKAIHLLLLMEDGEVEKLKQLYSYSSRKKFFSENSLNLIYPIKKEKVNSYTDYLYRMQNLATIIEIEDVGLVESFLFGYSLKVKNDNPRLKIIELLNQYKEQIQAY